MSNIYVLTLKTYDWYETTEVVSASTSWGVVADYAADMYPDLELYDEDAPIYVRKKGAFQRNEIAHLTILVFND